MEDMTLERESCEMAVNRLGWDGFLARLNMGATRLWGFDPQLYSVSREWCCLPQVKVLKARGANGDLLVRLT